MSAPLKTFIIYSRHDAKFKDELLTHLDAMVRKGFIQRWVDSDLLPGEEWEKRIEAELDAAHLVLMLVSADALNSDFIQKKELKTAIEKKQRGAARVIPILVRDCLWELEEELAALQMLPKDEQGRIWAVENWTSRSSAWANAGRELLKLIQEIREAVAKENAEQERVQREEQAKAEKLAAAEKAEKLRHRKDESAWEKLQKEIAAADTFNEKIELVQVYLEEEQYHNHQEDAENLLHDLIAEKEVQEKFEERKKKKAAAQPKNGQTLRDLPYAPEMVFVEGGSFQMGSNEAEREKPIHTVMLDSFWIGKYPVTFEEYDAYCEASGAAKPNDQGWGRGHRPVINVSWEEAKKYTVWLSEKTGKPYRLPSEAEWEYAARGGNQRKGFTYAGSNDLKEVGWYWENSGEKPLSGEWGLDKITKNKCRTQQVGQKKPNELGLYDMNGNVWEWCEDDWHHNYKGAPADCSAWTAGGDPNHAVLRGGSWLSSDNSCRAAYRSRNSRVARYNGVGFRVARDVGG